MITSEIYKTLFPYIIGMGIFAIGFQYLAIKFEKYIKNKYGESSSERIERLTKSLKEASELSSEIENEINRRHKLVEKLESDIERYNELAQLKSSEVEAVVQAMSGEIQKESSKSFILSAALNFLFFIAGILVTIYFS